MAKQSTTTKNGTTPVKSVADLPGAYDISDITNLVKQLKETTEKRLEMDHKIIMAVCLRAREHFMCQTPCVLVDAKPGIAICGDIHGQFDDLRAIFDHVGWPPASRYLFMGDYVDRGPNSLETICLLLGLCLVYPQHVYLLRGNHESKAINRVYGFYEEIEERYGGKRFEIPAWRNQSPDVEPFRSPLWHLFQEVFATMPLCGLVADRIFCMHGGISQELKNFAQLGRIVRPCDVPDFGLVCDLLWADPDASVNGYVDSPRGASFVFGEAQVKHFCVKMNIDLICRAHQVVQDGYEFFAQQRMVTIFSAPAYCGEFNNSAAVLVFDGKTLQGQFYIRKPSGRSDARPIFRTGSGPVKKAP